MPPDDAFVNDAATWRMISEPVEHLATVHAKLTTASVLFDCFESPPFNDGSWAFRGLGDVDHILRANIEGVATKPGIA